MSIDQAIFSAIRNGHRRLNAICMYCMAIDVGYFYQTQYRLRELKKDDKVYYAQRSPGVRPGWYLSPSRR